MIVGPLENFRAQSHGITCFPLFAWLKSSLSQTGKMLTPSRMLSSALFLWEVRSLARSVREGPWILPIRLLTQSYWDLGLHLGLQKIMSIIKQRSEWGKISPHMVEKATCHPLIMPEPEQYYGFLSPHLISDSGGCTTDLSNQPLPLQSSSACCLGHTLVLSHLAPSAS